MLILECLLHWLTLISRKSTIYLISERKTLILDIVHIRAEERKSCSFDSKGVLKRNHRPDFGKVRKGNCWEYLNKVCLPILLLCRHSIMIYSDHCGKPQHSKYIWKVANRRPTDALRKKSITKCDQMRMLSSTMNSTKCLFTCWVPSPIWLHSTCHFQKKNNTFLLSWMQPFVFSGAGHKSR